MISNKEDPKELLARLRLNEKQEKERRAVEEQEKMVSQVALQEKERIIADAIGKIFYLTFDGFDNIVFGYNKPTFNFPLVENEKILVDYHLLPNEVDIGSKLWIMFLGQRRERYSIYFAGIPSPIKEEYIEQWNNMMAAWKKGEAIPATVVDIRDNFDTYARDYFSGSYISHLEHYYKGIILDIGCEVQALWIYPRRYIKGKKIGDTVMVHIKDISGGEVNTHLKFSVLIGTPNLVQIEKEYEKIKEEHIKKIIQEKQKDTFILDTNVIMDFPELFTYFLELKKQIVVAYNVVEELDGLKDSDDEDRASKARRGLHAINDNIRSIKMETPSSDLLPKGLGKKNDNDIISVALKYKNNASNALLVTNDIGVTVKSKALEIDVWDCVEDMELFIFYARYYLDSRELANSNILGVI